MLQAVLVQPGVNGLGFATVGPGYGVSGANVQLVGLSDDPIVKAQAAADAAAAPKKSLLPKVALAIGVAVAAFGSYKLMKRRRR